MRENKLVTGKLNQVLRPLLGLFLLFPQDSMNALRPSILSPVSSASILYLPCSHFTPSLLARMQKSCDFCDYRVLKLPVEYRTG
jgi:hypothetical protein